MAEPKIEDGHIDFANELAEFMASYRISGEEWQVLLVIMRKTWGWHKSWDRISLKQFWEATDMKKPSILRALNKLISKHIISKRANKNPHSWHINSHYDGWKAISKKANVSKRANGVSNNVNGVSKRANLQPPQPKPDRKHRPPKETLTNETLSKEKTFVGMPKNVAEVFSFWKNQLNHPKALLTKDRQTKISARLKEGYILEQCKNAIEGCKLSAYHMGDNPQVTVYDSIELIFRNGDKIEQFINIYKEVLKHGKTGKRGKRDTRAGWEESEKYRHLYRK